MKLYPTWNEEEAWKSYAKDKPNIYKVVDFHTHHSGSNRSDQDAAGLGIQGWPLGIIVQGFNKYSVYDSDLRRQQAPPEALKECLPLVNK
jgi:hypothetical protein